MNATYAALWCKSNYSFLQAASHPDELIDEAHRLGIRAIALTDRDGVYGIVRAHVRARELGMHFIVGSEITLTDGSRVVLLATDRKGYANLCRLISKGRLRSPKGLSEVSIEEVCDHADGLLCLWGGAQSTLAGEVEPKVMAEKLRDAFNDRIYALLTRHQETFDDLLERRLRDRAAAYGLSLVAATETLYHTAARAPLYDVLTCIRHGVTLAASSRFRKLNDNHALLSPYGFSKRYRDDDAAVRRTHEVAERCLFTLNEIRYRYPLERLPDGSNSAEWLRTLTMDGAQKRYGGSVPHDVRRQLDKELTLIHDLEYEGYFLTMWEIVRYCEQNNILCQGRGSAANSAVCFCLGITAVDPVRMGLLFERFLSRERAEPPDVDLDIEHDRREEVIQHVYMKYGRTHAAMVANFIRYRAKSAVRDVGKAFGLPETVVERMTGVLSHDEFPTDTAMHRAGMNDSTQLRDRFQEMLRTIVGFPRHLSIHPGGFLLGHEPVHDLVPIENATMPDRTVIQWDKEDIEDLGLFKVDLLGLGALNVVHRSFDLIEKHHGQTHSLATIPPDDRETFDLIQAADTVGTFQIESRAQMSMLPRLKPERYYDLVIEVSIVRPGPITGGMVHPYLRRRSGEEEVTYPHECLKPVLERTLGVPLFQEQVMQLAMVAADYSAGEADQLRRDMAAWRSAGRLEQHRDRLITRMVHKGIQREFAERVFEQIRGFGEYGFPESHAASFALIAYATAWLKRHYPASFLCALLNAQPMGFYSPSTLVEDARRHGVIVLAADVLKSDWDCTLEPTIESSEGLAVRVGLRYVKGLSEQDGRRIVACRKPVFGSLNEFAAITQLETGVLARLAESGALESFNTQRRDALWNSLGIQPSEYSGLRLDDTEPAITFDALNGLEISQWDYEFNSLTTHGHPLEHLRDELARMGLPDAKTVHEMADGSRVRYAGIVNCRQRPGTANGVVFMTLDDETGFVNLVLWEKVFRRVELLAKTASFLGVTGKVQSQSGVVHVIVETLWKPDTEAILCRYKSRDFH